jgi:D-cysteine desulfhydrase family pyridoxal phosphate-dependent enzyme
MERSPDISRTLLQDLSRLPRVPLGVLPTPLEPLYALSRALSGPRLFIKRDDLTGLALGGNKTRKLEFLIGDALARGADTIVTAGAAQSNHCRQTAAAAARCGLACELVLGGEAGVPPQGNLLLDLLFGAAVHFTGMERRGERMREIEQGLRAAGRKPYVIPYGGSNALGAAAYALAMAESLEQFAHHGLRPDAMVVASSSGGTQAGLLAGARMAGYDGKIIGIGIDKGERGPGSFAEDVLRLAQETLRFLGARSDLPPDAVIVNEDFHGAGYGVVGELEKEAIRVLALKEGILLDPVYTARAMGALLAMIRAGKFGREQSVLFWHTGGAPALFAYASELRSN